MTTLEHAARAVARADCTGLDDATYADLDDLWRDYIPIVRAVLEAIREPSHAMIEAAWFAAPEKSGAATWRAMLDALLDEQPDPAP